MPEQLISDDTVECPATSRKSIEGEPPQHLTIEFDAGKCDGNAVEYRSRFVPAGSFYLMSASGFQSESLCCVRINERASGSGIQCKPQGRRIIDSDLEANVARVFVERDVACAVS